MKTIIVTKEKLEEFVAQFNEENCIYVIPFEKDLDGTTLTMPANCVLKFENGGMLKNGTLKGDNTFIDAHLDVVFKDMLFGRVYNERPAFVNDFVRPEWFACDDDAEKINQSIKFASISGNKVQLLPKIYEISSAIKIYSGTVVEGTIFGAVDRDRTQGTRIKYKQNDNVEKGVAMEFHCVGEGYLETCFKFKVSDFSLEYNDCADTLEPSLFAKTQNFIGMDFVNFSSCAPRSGMIENVKIVGFGVGINIQAISYVKFNKIDVDNCLTAIKVGGCNESGSFSLLEFAWFDEIIINVGNRYMSENVTGIELNSGNNIYFNEIDVNDCNTGIYFYTNAERALFNIFMNRLNITRCTTCMSFYSKESFITRVNISEVTMDYSMYVRTSPLDGVYQIPPELYGLKFSRVTPYMIGDSSFINIYESTKYTDSVPNHTSISVDTASGLALTSCSFDKMRLLNPIEGFVGLRKLGLLNFKSYGEITVPAGATQSALIELEETNIFKKGVYPMPIVTPVTDGEIPQTVFSEENAALKMKLVCQQTSAVDRKYRFYFPQIN